MRVLVTGSREWRDEGFIIGILEYWRWRAIGAGDTEFVVVHGHCPKGADRIADVYVQSFSMGWKSLKPVAERHPANWDEFGKRAGFVRNAGMVALGADLCLAFIKNNSKGATMTADLAEKAGIETVRYTQ